MKRFSIWLSGLGLAAIATGSIFASQPASAQPAYGSYVGIGPGFGITKDDDGDGQQLSAVVAARYKLLELPISLRAQAFIGSSFAVVPTVSYDIPLNWQTDAYLGAGVSLAGAGISPVGDKISFALQPGIDYMIPNSNTAVFGNAVIAFDAYRDGGGPALAIQGGVGLRF